MRRRTFVAAGSLVGLGAALGAWRFARARGAQLPENSTLKRDPHGILDLAAGFRYRVVQREGQRMSDGHRAPGRPDAMATFALPDGGFALMRNHELDAATGQNGPYFSGQKPSEHAYDADKFGGVSRLVFDAQGRLRSSNLVLTGTARNCAAGVSPWGYLSCEESVDAGHGFVFLCDPFASSVQPPRKIPAYGRFLHEAAAVDPGTYAAYLTEDRGDGCLYRFVPADKARPFAAGQLQALAVVNAPRLSLAESAALRTPMQIHWVDVPAAAGNDDGLREAAQARGAAIVRRGEGIWRVENGFAFSSTSGGVQGLGQIFALTPTAQGGELRLIHESTDAAVLDMPDNLTYAPWGDLVVCEDNLRSAYLRVVSLDGRVFPLAHNALSQGEFAGVCFSPSGRQLFVNLQEEGLTLAIEGPWESLPRS